jgi:hypothetical protein
MTATTVNLENNCIMQELPVVIHFPGLVDSIVSVFQGLLFLRCAFANERTPLPSLHS